MSYFDHVQCHSCGARMDPEKIVPGRGEMPACPHCGARLNLADLFGVKDAFVGMHDDEGNDHSLDDLVGGELYDGRYAGGRAPEKAPPPAPRSASRPAGRPAPGPGRRGLPGPSTPPPTSRPNALVPQGTGRSDAAEKPVSALDLLREMKKR